MLLIEYILWVVSIITIAGSILNVKKSHLCFVLWTICNIFWLIYDIHNHAYARTSLDVVNLATSLWGLISWTKEKYGRDTNWLAKIFRTSTRDSEENQEEKI